jgi:hypothetical protein
MMTRREFLVKSGTVITAAAFASALGGAGKVLADARGPSGKSYGGKRPDPSTFPQPVMKAIAMGINAPNSHNVQSWKFLILDDFQMNLYVDEKRLLPATDPPARQIHMSAGCFLETMTQGATLIGCEAEVALFPEGYSSAADFGRKPVAKVSLKQTGKVPSPLADYITRRQTSRETYTGHMVTDSELQGLKDLSGNQHSELFFYNDDLSGFFDVFYEAFAIESRTYATNEETRGWFRFSEAERREKRDGLSVPQGGMSGLVKVFAEASLKDGDEKTWHSEKSIEGSLKNFKKGLESSKGLVIWKTKTNGFEDWVRAGMDYARFGLAMTKMGFYAHPYNQVIQEYPEMNELRERFDSMMGVSEPEKIQMIVRIGRSKTPYYSYRRNVDDFMIA